MFNITEIENKMNYWKSNINKAENVFLCVSLSVCPFAIEIHTSRAMTMSVCTCINTRPGKVLVEIRS